MPAKFYVFSESRRYFNTETGKWISFDEAMNTREEVSVYREFETNAGAAAAARVSEDLKISTRPPR